MQQAVKDVDREELPVVNAAVAAHHGHTSWYVAAGHIVTALLGPGILAVPYVMSRLGWVGGILAYLAFFSISLWTSSMMAEVYQVDGKRHGRYDVAVRSILGHRHATFLALSQHTNLVLANVGFQVAAADSLRYIASAACQLQGQPGTGCWSNQPLLTIAIGILQLLLSQLKNLQAARLTSAIGSAACFMYSVLVVVLAATQAGNRKGSVTGYSAPRAEKVLSAFSSLGAVAFGLNAPIITFEVADTLREPPAAAISIKKSLALSLGSCLACFLAGGTLAYSALGDTNSNANFLLAFQDLAPAWVLVFGSVMVVLNMVSAYQVCGQPTFAAVEDGVWSQKCNRCVSRSAQNSSSSSSSSSSPAAVTSSSSNSLHRRCWLLSLIFRSCYVGVTTLLAVALPFFAIILGLVGAATYFQTGILYPILMHRVVHPPGRGRSVFMCTVLCAFAAVTVLMLIGSAATIAVSAARLSPLKV